MSGDIEFRTIHLRIEGRVQGVGFRYWVRNEAARLGLDGWVRNRRDGAVEAVFSGPPDAVAAMQDLCGKGPLGSKVRHVALIQDGGGVAAGFEIKQTV